MIGSSLVLRVSSFAEARGVDGVPVDTGVEGLSVYRSRISTALTPCLYKPTFCLVIQGSKEVHLGARRVSFSAGESLIVSHDIPMVSRISEASEKAPYLALSLPVDVNTMRGLANEIDEAVIDQENSQTLKVGDTEPAIVDAMTRLFALIGQPVQARVIAPLIIKEIYIRLLLAPHGEMLRQILQQGSAANRISKVLAVLSTDFAQSFTVDDLAGIATMSPSSFYEYFKAMTSTTPLQYQKDLRLLEARRLLMDVGHTVSEVAFQVGYQSPTQFSREYSRKFGNSPSSDKKRLIHA